MANVAVWFEIPSRDFERAVKFYEAIFLVTMSRMNVGGDMAVFPAEESAVSGAIVAPQPGYTPCTTGATVYLDGGEDLAHTLSRVNAAGGKILTPKTALPPGMGHFAHFEDSEGNRVGLHSMN